MSVAIDARGREYMNYGKGECFFQWKTNIIRTLSNDRNLLLKPASIKRRFCIKLIMLEYFIQVSTRVRPVPRRIWLKLSCSLAMAPMNMETFTGSWRIRMVHPGEKMGICVLLGMVATCAVLPACLYTQRLNRLVLDSSLKIRSRENKILHFDICYFICDSVWLGWSF